MEESLLNFASSIIMAPNYSHTTSNIRVNPNCSIRADNAFGPVVERPCRDGSDFTLLFEQSILSIGPSSVFLLVLPLRLFFLYRSKGTVVVSRWSVYTHKAVRPLRVYPFLCILFMLTTILGSHIASRWAQSRCFDTMDDQTKYSDSSFGPLCRLGLHRRPTDDSSLIPGTHSIDPDRKSVV